MSKAQNEHTFSGLLPTADLRLGARGYVGACLIEVSCRPYFTFPKLGRGSCATNPRVPFRARQSPPRGTSCGLFSCGQARCGAIRRTALAHAQPVIIASFAGDGLASGTGSGMHSLPLIRELPRQSIPSLCACTGTGQYRRQRRTAIGSVVPWPHPVTGRRLSRPGSAWPFARRC
jgi:hypothetical protein